MKVFISWSGTVSHEMAQALAEWLPNVIQAVKPFLSSEAIQKGARWFEEIGNQLEETHFGILCLTHTNITAPWILFEAGALSKQLQIARVVPLLVDLKPSDLTPPLSQFNAVVAPTRSEIEKLLRAMNGALGDNRLSDTQFNKAFEREWTDMEKRIAKINDLQRKQTHPAHAAPRDTREMVEEILDITRGLAREKHHPPLTLSELVYGVDSVPPRPAVLRVQEALRKAAQGPTLADAAPKKKGV